MGVHNFFEYSREKMVLHPAPFAVVHYIPRGKFNPVVSSLQSNHWLDIGILYAIVADHILPRVQAFPLLH